MHTRAIRMAFLLALSLVSAPAESNADEAKANSREDKGEAILLKYCVRCHAIGATGNSTHAQAPPFRNVVTRYPLDDLAESLAEGIVTGHPDMPQFEFAPSDISSILSYLDKLKRETAGERTIDAPKQ